MNAKRKNALKAAAVAAGLIAVLLPTGCSAMTAAPSPVEAAQPAPGSTVVAPPTVD